MNLNAEQVAWLLTQVPDLPEHWLVYLYHTRAKKWKIYGEYTTATRFETEHAALLIMTAIVKSGKATAAFVMHIPAPRA